MSTLPLEIVICYTIVVSLSIVLKIIKRSDKFKELYNKIKGLKKTVEDSIKTGSINDLNSIMQDFQTINNTLEMYDDILFEIPVD
jgi:hypothetical protein